MTAKKKPPPRDEDEAQSKRFLDLVRELEVGGDLSPTEAEGLFDALVEKALPEQRPKPR
jgi:hypothetical protein